MKRFFILIVPVLLILGSCVSKSGDASPLVPADAYAALFVESPASLFKSTDAFFKAAKLDRLTEGKSLLEKFQERSSGENNLKDMAKDLDFGKPMAIVIVPAEAEKTKRAMALIWLPLKHGKDSFTRIIGSLGDYKGTSAFVDGYAVLGLNGPVPTALPSRTADLSRLRRYPADSVKGWLNVDALQADFPGDWSSALKNTLQPPSSIGEPLLENTNPEEPSDPGAPYNFNERNFDWDKYQGESDESGSSPLGLNGMAELESLLSKLADNVQALDFALGVGEKGVFLRFGASVPPDKALGKFTAAVGPSKGLPYLKYLEADALAGGVSSLDPTAMTQFVKAYLNALNLGGYLGKPYFDLLASSMEAQGPDSAFSFDATVDPEFMQKAQRIQAPQEISDLIRNSLSIRVSSVNSLRDVSLYRKTLKSLEDKGLIGETFQNLLSSSGINLSMTVKEGSVAGTDYDSLRISLTGPAIESSPESKAIWDAVLDKLTLYSSYGKDRAYTVMGDPSLLAEAMRRDRAAVPLSSDAGYANFAGVLPADTRGVYYISLRRIFELLATFMPNKNAVNPQDLDKLYGYFAADKGSVETGIFLGSKDVRALVNLIPGLPSSADQRL